MGERPVVVTLAEIARIAGVGRAAVSNWRRRHRTFPSPVSGTDTSPQFSLVQVEEWLREHDKLGSSTSSLERLWPAFEALGDRDRMGRVVAEFGARLRDASHRELDPSEEHLVDQALELSVHEGGQETFQYLLDRWLGTHIRQITTTPTPLASFMAEVAAHARPGKISTLLDPACGAGGLLLAGAERWKGAYRLLGHERDPVLAMLARTRLSLLAEAPEIDLRTIDTLRSESPVAAADVILCNPPTNERDWGHAELATDRRWLFGLPPRTESELAWVQHIVSTLSDDGVAVVLLPPAVASRRAGRRIRAAMLRAGSLRAAIALPPGAAPPFGVGLHLWILKPPTQRRTAPSLLMVDTADCRATLSAAGAQAVDWDAVRDRVFGAMAGKTRESSIEVPVLDLLGEETDLTPARHAPTNVSVSVINQRRSWRQFDSSLQEAQDLGKVLRDLKVVREVADAHAVAVADLEQAGTLALAPGQAIPDGYIRRGERPDDGVPVLTVADLREGQPPQFWITAEDVEQLERDKGITLTSSNDVVVVVPSAEFSAWVDVAAPTVLGPHIHRLRPDTEHLDPWFLAACLRAHFNARQAGTHATTTSRVDPRRLLVPRLPIGEQRRYGDIHRRLVRFEHAIANVGGVGATLSRTLTELLAAGRLR
ncbi:restriction endonuclease subunit M [Spongiactinospora rosea]|uniref:Restriction endonuclease subunit M n=2 Tax=Spongiactinospora rosea TaxID=2248750 RepID=A0A366M389_9ACTN|nr:restriction endonuclease subunit M [Spongiactinospora rosea]